MEYKNIIESFSELISTGERNGYKYFFGKLKDRDGVYGAVVVNGTRLASSWCDNPNKEEALEYMLDAIIGLGIPHDDAKQWAKSCDKVKNLAQVLHRSFEKDEFKPENTVQVVAHHLSSWDDSFFRLVEAKRKFNKK